MIRKILFISAISLSLAFIGCGDDDDNNTANNGNNGTNNNGTNNNGTNNNGTNNNGTNNNGTNNNSNNGTVGPPPVDACLNAADIAILSDDTVDVGGIAKTCGTTCLASNDPACAADCIATDTSLSTDCSDCYGRIVACSVENCLNECLSGTDEECGTCQVTAGCVDALNLCTGDLTPPATACETYCADFEEKCPTQFGTDYTDAAGCATACGAMTEGTADETTGDTVQCRISHIALSTVDDDAHCTDHAGLTPTASCVAPATACETYCAQFEIKCATQFGTDYTDAAGCATACAGLTEGTAGETSGDTVQCRISHTALSTADDDAHCTDHAGLTPSASCI